MVFPQHDDEDEEEIKIKWLTVSILHSLRRELTYTLTCRRRSLVSGTQNDIVVSWITLRGMIKVYWLNFSQNFGSCCLLRFCRKFGPKLASHYKAVKNGSMVRRTVRTMFSELKVQLRNELQFVEMSEVCSANKQFAQLRTSLKDKSKVRGDFWHDFW